MSVRTAATGFVVGLACLLTAGLLSGCTPRPAGSTLAAPSPPLGPPPTSLAAALGATDAATAPAGSGAAVATVPAGGSTFVGQRVEQLRGDLVRLQQAIGQYRTELRQIKGTAGANAEAYHNVVSSIYGRLQEGSTPGNPILVQEWNRAQSQLGQVDSEILKLNDLSNRVSNDATLSGYLLDAVRAAYGLSGAVEEDHRQLRLLEDEAGRAGLEMNRLQADVNQAISRQIAYVNGERGNLQNLSELIKQGDLYSSAMRDRLYTAPSLVERPRSMSGNPFPAGGMQLAAADANRPLVVIKFDRDNVQYEQPLYQALTQALDQQPGASFDVVGVTPPGGGSARSNAERVSKSMAAMGVPSDRMRVSTTTSGDARGREVYIYVR